MTFLGIVFLLVVKTLRAFGFLAVAALAVQVIGLVVENERGQILLAAAHGFAILEEEERLVGGTARIFLLERGGDSAIDNGDSKKLEAVSAEFQPQLGVSVVLVDRQLMGVDYAIHMIWWLIVSNISEV